MEYLQLTMDEYIQSKEEIKTNLVGIVKSFVRIGWQLSRINRSEAYKMDGYNSIAEFALAEYGMNPSGVSRFMTVYEKYSEEGDSPELKEQYRGFKFAQLTEMLNIPEDEHAMFTAETKREAIRDFKDYKKENESNPENLTRWMQEPEDNIGKAILHFFKENREIMNRLYGSSAYKNWNPKDMAEIVNPSENSHFRYKTVFLMMYDYNKGLMVNEFGSSPTGMSWEEFFRKAEDIFGDETDGSRTWETCFGQEDDQIPGQDSIENHPEFMPVPEKGPSENGKKQGTDQSETEKKADHTKEPEDVPEEINGHQVIGFAPAQQKTEEQKYAAEQNRIDKETKKKLQEMEDEEKMAHLPSDDGPKVHQIRLAANYYDDVAAGRKTFELRKNDRGYGVGHILEMMEFREGRNTGRVIHADVVYMLEDYAGLQEGYCILGIRVTDFH